MALALQAKPSQAKPSQAKPSQAKPNSTYYQMETSSFAKGGIIRLRTPFLVRAPGKAFFVSTGFTG